ncbi:MAG: SURF1 family protein [Pseudomonadota bacterium]|nr:SURF1 family protein [Pseudomonadota bacterium]
MRFAPNWKLTLFAVVFVPLLLSLGTWQGLRAAEKRGLEAARDAAAVLPAAMLEPTEAIPPGHLTPVRVQGRFDTTRIVLLDNRTHMGRAGYEVFARLEDVASEGGFLVGLGWVPAPADRSVPALDPLPGGPVALRAVVLRKRLEPPVFGAIEDSEAWPRRVQRIDVEALEKSFGQTLYPWVLMAEAGEPGVATHVFRAVHMSSATHLGYAVQWYGLAAILLLGWAYVSFRRPSEEPDQNGKAAGPAEESRAP